MMTDNINIKLTTDTGQAVQSTENYKKTLKDLKDQMVQLQVETNGLTEATAEQRQQYAELEQQAGQIADALGDVSSRVKANADDFQNFNAALEGLKGGTAIAQGLVGTLDLLGVSNTGAENVVKTLMSLQGVMNSINAVQQIFNKDSKLMIALQKLKITGAKNEAVAMEGAAVATTAEAGATKVATTATRSFTAALMSNPFGLIAVAIATVTTAIIGLTGAMDDDTSSVESNTEATDKNTSSWTNNAAARREALKGYASMLSDIENTGLSQLEREGALLEFVRSKLGIQVESVKDARKAYEDFKKSTDGITQSMEVFYNEGTQIHREFTTLKDAALSAANAHRMLKDAQEDYKIAAESGVSQEVLDELDEEIQKWEANSRYADQMLNIIEQRTVGHYKNLLKERKKAQEEAAKNDKPLGLTTDFVTYEEAYAKLYNDIAETRKKVDETSYKDSEKNTDSYIQNRKDAMKKAEEDFIAEQASMLHSLGLTEEEALNDDAYQEWLDVKESALSQFLEKSQNEIDEANNVRERKEIDAQNRIDDARLQTRLINLKEGSEEYWELQQEIEEERFEQEMEELRRQLEDKQITQDEYDAIAEQKEAEHQQRIAAIYDEAKQNKIKNILEVLDTISFYAEQAGKIVQAASNFVMALQDAELENAEGDEKKQKEIKKKYAVANMMMTIGQIAVETIMGSVSALANGIRDMGMPVGAIVGGITAALVTATGIAATVKAVREKNNIMKMAKGGLIVGPSHSEGGVPYELEGGEAVLNKKAMAIPQYRSLASAMNVSTGGVAFAGTSGGGLLSATIDDRVVDSIVSRTVAAVTAIPVVVSEESITDAQRKVGVLEGRSRLG